jgi:cyclic-di-AMP phosphodiesterase PgpH
MVLVPQSAETAVVMLADASEAMARQLATPTPERVRDVIERVVAQRLEEGQLRDAPLSLRQLTIVKREFARVLGGMYHARVEYPTPAAPTEAARV